MNEMPKDDAKTVEELLVEMLDAIYSRHEWEGLGHA